MLQDPLTLSKLIVLYMLNKVDFSLTTAQICDYMLEKDHTTFLNFQHIVKELSDTDLIETKTGSNRTYLTITEEGQETLHYFKNRIKREIQDDINAYLKENEFTLRNEFSIQSDYYKSTSGEYEAHLVARDRDITLIDLTLSVPIEETASAICEHWREKNKEIYQFLIRELF